LQRAASNPDRGDQYIRWRDCINQYIGVLHVSVLDHDVSVLNRHVRVFNNHDGVVGNHDRHHERRLDLDDDWGTIHDG
jgi:hypothetical protein